MGVKRVDIKNIAFYLPTKMINLWDFHPKKLEINKEDTDEINIYYVRNDIGPFYLTIDDLCGYFEENDWSKYLNLVYCDEGQYAVYARYVKIWEEIRNKIRFGQYNKDYAMIRFDSDDDLPLG